MSDSPTRRVSIEMDWAVWEHIAKELDTTYGGRSAAAAEIRQQMGFSLPILLGAVIRARVNLNPSMVLVRTRTSLREGWTDESGTTFDDAEIGIVHDVLAQGVSL